MVVFKKNAGRVLNKSSASTIDDIDNHCKLSKQGTYGSADDSLSRKRSGSFSSLHSIQEAQEEEDNQKVSTVDTISADILQWVSKSFKHEMVGILVSDMSGFTRLTRTYGIVHFASVIIRMRQVCLPILHHFGAAFITTEADDFIVIFRSAAAAIKAAHSMIFTVEKYNESLPPDRKHFALTLNGIGIDFGKGPLVDKNNKLHGTTFSNAYALGEELSEKGCVLVSGNVRAEIQSDSKFTHTFFDEIACESEEASAIAGCVGGLYNFGMKNDDKPFSIPGVDDNRYLQKELVCLAQRHSPTLSPAELEILDSNIKKKFMSERTVLMFEFNYGFVQEPEIQMRLEFEVLACLKNTFVQFNGEEVEDVLYSFDSPVDAVLATLQIREQVELWQNSADWTQVGEAPDAIIKGYGIHCGQVLRVPGTDVHWGDPINTASKLGQDLAEGGNIIISDVIHDIVRDDVLLKDVVFEPVELHKSKVTFNCFKVSRARDPKPDNVTQSASSRCNWWGAMIPKCTCAASCCDSTSEIEYMSAPVLAKHYDEEVYNGY